MGGLQCHHCQDSVKLQFQRACFQFKALIIQAAGRWGGIKQTDILSYHYLFGVWFLQQPLDVKRVRSGELMVAG